jgi:predicted  nucleic acid-binding Zn-ribbon protein
MAKTKAVSVEEKLRALYDLQLIDSRIDEMKLMRGELPLEVEDLEDDIVAYETRISKFEDEIVRFEEGIANKKIEIKEAQAQEERYKEQQKNVRNNREFLSLSKEIEYKDLEVQHCEKQIGEMRLKIERKKEVINETKNKLVEKRENLKHKKAELDDIIKETEKEEMVLLKESEKFGQILDESLLKAYKRIRSKVRNGMAVVTVERGAAGGSFFTIPPQRQLEIAERKKIITDEHSGRILVDAELAAEERERIAKIIK